MRARQPRFDISRVARHAVTESKIEQRGKGIGTLLLDRVESELDRLGITDTIIGTLPRNTRTLDIYRRRGFEPTWLVMTRFARRGKTEGVPHARRPANPDQ